MQMISFSPGQNYVHFTVRLMIIGKQPRGAWKEETRLQIYMFCLHRKKAKKSKSQKKPGVVRQGFEHEKGITRAFLLTSLVNIPSYLSNYTEVIVMALLVV